MGFYTEPAFFALVAVAAVPAVVLGCLEKSQRAYGLVASIAFLALLFAGGAVEEVAWFVLFIVLSCALMVLVRHLFAFPRGRDGVDAEREAGAPPSGRTAAPASGRVAAPASGSVADPATGQVSAPASDGAFAPASGRAPAKPSGHALAIYRVALALTIAPLFAYKLVATTGATAFGFIGISYLTFKAVQVLIELRDGLIEDMNLVDYLYFMLFFPVFTSGPIMRSRPFVERLRTPLSRADYLDGLGLGVLRLLGGAVYKFVFAALANWASWFIPQMVGTASSGALVVGELLVAFFYGLYLFFDFAGYSLMAMGLGAVFGVEVPRNFNMPFLSVDIKDFWNRWHITLSFWLRDFVFMRFTRACRKRKVFSSRVTTACAGYIVNMALMGAWHAFSPQCIVYGLYHGLLLAACELFQRKSSFYKAHKDDRSFKVVSWAITMVAVFFGFSLFSGQVF